MLGYTLLFILIILVSSLLFLPFTLIVNTIKNDYSISLPGYFKLNLLIDEGFKPLIKLRVFFLKFKVRTGKRSKRDSNVKIKKNESGKNKSFDLRLLNKLIKCIKIKKLKADIDTGDFPLNAMLFPITKGLNTANVDLNINFENRNLLDTKIVIQSYKIIIVFIKHKISKLKNN